jgi:hypothetical protein
MVQITDVPRAAMFLIARITRSAPSESNPEVGCIVTTKEMK